MSSIVSIAIIIILSLISSAWKKKNQEKESTPANETDFEEELRRMAERMMGKKEEETPRQTATPPVPVVEAFRSLRDEHRESKSSPYETFDDDEGDIKYEKYNRIPDTTVVDYSERDIKRVEEQQQGYKKPSYTTYSENYEQKVLESFKKGKELHTVMDSKEKEKTAGDVIEKHVLLEDFDPRKAVIYAEIFKRPEY